LIVLSDDWRLKQCWIHGFYSQKKLVTSLEKEEYEFKMKPLEKGQLFSIWFFSREGPHRVGKRLCSARSKV
jgi:hypothetical protein